jgi:hypothetical protein
MSCLVVAIELSTSCTPPEFNFLPPPPESSCFDDELNGLEGDKDCGGDCALLCEVGRGCNQGTDCQLGSCVERRCQADHCVDQSLGDGETDVDCGGSECVKCGVSQRCRQSLDCRSNVCMDGECVATGCDDAEMGGAETDLDCGGGTCPGCEKGKRCSSGGDCQSGICLDGVCSTEACADGKQGASETGVDCGGSCPKVCGPVSCLEDPLGCDPPVIGGSGGHNGQGGSNPNGGGGSAGERGGTGGTDTGEGGSSGGGSSGTGGTATGGNLGGASGAGGATGGLSGSAGATTGGTAAGGAATGGSSSLESCTGCARLSVPLAAPTNKANYVITLPAVMDFRNAVITYRLFKRAGTGGEIRGYIQHSGNPDFGQLFQSRPLRLSACDGWEEIVWNVADEGGNYDKTIVGRVGIHVIGIGSTEWTNPTIVYLDSISVAGPSVGPWNFADAASINATATYGSEPDLLWRNLGDDPVEGSEISWLGP